MKRSLATTLCTAGMSACLALPLLPATASAISPDAAGGLLLPGPHGLRPASVGATSEESENWSGYIRSGSSGAFNTSTASWTVPTVTSGHNGYSSTWVGIDGASSNDDYLIQTGTEADMVDGSASYFAWWEVITPSDEAPEVRYNTTVRPGDTITASVTKKSSGSWSMSLTDHTSGVTSSHTSSYAGPGKSAEWIQEDTDVDNVISPAPDWHSVKFHSITLDGGNPDLSAGAKVEIYDELGTQEDTTSAPNSTDNGFTVKWVASGVGTPV
jgi:hypothetical protein